jgi:hypothetical protein
LESEQLTSLSHEAAAAAAAAADDDDDDEDDFIYLFFNLDLLTQFCARARVYICMHTYTVSPPKYAHKIKLSHYIHVLS